jgi:hypothetical protein
MGSGSYSTVSHEGGLGSILDGPRVICGGQSGTRTGFLQVLRFPPVISSQHCSTFTCIYTLLLREGQTGKAWEPAIKQYSFAHREALYKKRTSKFLS